MRDQKVVHVIGVLFLDRENALQHTRVPGSSLPK